MYVLLCSLSCLASMKHKVITGLLDLRKFRLELSRRMLQTLTGIYHANRSEPSLQLLCCSFLLSVSFATREAETRSHEKLFCSHFFVLEQQGLLREFNKGDPYPWVCVAHMMLGHTPSQEDHPCAFGSQHHVVQLCNIRTQRQTNSLLLSCNSKIIWEK